MAKFVFTKDNENVQGTMYGIAKDNIDLAARGINDQGYKIINATDAEYESIRLDKKMAYYNADGLVWSDNTCIFSTLEILQNCVSTMSETPYPTHNQCIVDLKTQTFDNYTFPLTKTIPEIAEEKGITWTSHYEFL
jgi:hypothetical protein